MRLKEGGRWDSTGAREEERKTVESVGCWPLGRRLSGCGMTAQAQLTLDAEAGTGRSEGMIKPFMHSALALEALS